jgi:hypothetical protein
MSTVIRKGIIELELRAKQSRLESPQIDAAAKAYKETEKATQESAKAQQESVKVTREATKVNQEFGIKSVAAFREAGEGAFRMTRGLALLSASGSDDLKRLVQHVALAQGAFDVFAGGTKTVATLAAAFGPMGAAAGVATLAIGAGALAWRQWSSEAEAARRAAEETARSLEDLARSERGAAEARRQRISDLRIGAALTEAARFERIEGERRRAVSERGAIEDELLKSRFGRELRGEGPAERAQTLRILSVADPRELEYQKQLQKRLEDNAKRQLELERQLADRDIRQAKESLAFQPTSATIAGLVGGPAGQAAFGIDLATQLATYNAEVARTLSNAQQTLDQFVRLMEDAARRVAEIEGAQRQAAAANTK